jgi:hypothetical protein
MNEDNKASQYVEGNSRVRIALFAFLGLWGLIGFLLKAVAEKKLEKISEAVNATGALAQLDDILLKFLIVPMSIFCSIQGLYLIWFGARTIRAGVHPPPGAKMPFRTKVQTGTRARLSAAGYIFAGLCNLAIIAMLFRLRHELFRYI